MTRFISLLSFVFILSGCVSTPETGRKAFIVTSESEEKQLGVQAYQEILKKEKLSNNKRWNDILQRVGSRIAKAANKPDFKWEFKLIESPEQNAFCLPGGKVAVYTGILKPARTEAGLAAIIGHEVAHATARHGGQRMTAQMGTQLGMAAIGAAIGADDKNPTKRALMGALGVGSVVGVSLPFSRSNETEADEIGLIYMARAGYDPKEAPEFWKRFGSEGGQPPEFLSTHPSHGTRSRALDSQIPKVMPAYEASAKIGQGETL